MIPYEQAVKEMKKAIEKTYGRKGEEVVKMNFAAVDRGSQVTEVKVPEEWKNLKEEEEKKCRKRMCPNSLSKWPNPSTCRKETICLLALSWAGKMEPSPGNHCIRETRDCSSCSGVGPRKLHPV